jgi:hypothetical protein
VLPKQIKQADVTRMLFQLRLVSDRRGLERDQTTFTALQNVPDLVPANESAIIVESVARPAIAAAPAAAAEVDATDALKELLPKLSLEIRAAVDASLQKELASLRGFIGGAINTHTERLHGDLAALLPAPRTPEVDNPPLMVERSWSKITGWTLAVIALAGAAVMTWQWWERGSELAAVNTDLTAAYAELETLRARPAAAPAVAPVDPDAVTPAADAPDAAAASTGAVELVPNGGTVTPPAPIAGEQDAALPAGTIPSTAVPSAVTPPSATPTSATKASASAPPISPTSMSSAPISAAPAVSKPAAPATETRASQ